MVASLVRHVRTDDRPECSIRDRSRGNCLWRAGREHRPPASRDPSSLRVCLACRTVVGYLDPPAPLICPDLSFWAELKRQAMAMEYSGRGCRSRLNGWLYIAASDVPGALQFFKDLWRAE